MPTPDQQIAREDRAAPEATASAALLALARLLGRMAAREQLAASGQTRGDRHDAHEDAEDDHPDR